MGIWAQKKNWASPARIFQVPVQCSYILPCSFCIILSRGLCGLICNSSSLGLISDAAQKALGARFMGGRRFMWSVLILNHVYHRLNGSNVNLLSRSKWFIVLRVISPYFATFAVHAIAGLVSAIRCIPRGIILILITLFTTTIVFFTHRRLPRRVK